MEMQRARCRSCGADIVWVRMASGKLMAVNATPENRVVIEGERDGTPSGRVRATFVSHFATCPNADKHRRT